MFSNNYSFHLNIPFKTSYSHYLASHSFHISPKFKTKNIIVPSTLHYKTIVNVRNEQYVKTEKPSSKIWIVLYDDTVLIAISRI